MLVPRPAAGSSRHRLPAGPVWVRLRVDMAFAVGFGAGIAATVIGWLLGAGRHPMVGLGVLALSVAGVGAVCTPLGALAAAVATWALDTGFILNRFGVLTLDRRTVLALVVLTVAALAPSLITTWLGRARVTLLRVGPREQRRALGICQESSVRR